MLKIVKSRVYNFDSSNLVEVGVPEPPPPPPEPEEEEEEEEKGPTPEEIAAALEEEQKRQREEEIRRFNEAVIKRSEEIIRAKKKSMETEYERLVSSGQNAADKLIFDAKSKSKAIFDATEDECARLKELSRKEGFEVGYGAGREEALKKCEKYLEAAAMLLTEINARKEAYYIGLEFEMQKTVMEMVQKITMSEVKTDPEVIDRIAASAAKNFRNSDYVKISVAKGEASREFVTDKEFVRGLIPFIPEIEVEELDPRDVPSGTVVLDNGTEIIDASVPTQLDFLKEVMRNSQGAEENEN